MKKLGVFVLFATVLAGCATTTGADGISSVGMSVFKSAVDTKCRSELNANSTYKTISLIMTDAQKTTLENKVCGCVSEKAPESITLSELAQATVSQSARTQVVATAVGKTIGACISEFVSGS